MVVVVVVVVVVVWLNHMQQVGLASQCEGMVHLLVSTDLNS